MRKKIFILVLVLQIIPIIGWSQRVYIDLSGCDSTNNDKIKPGWETGVPVFADEFNFDSISSLTIGFITGIPAHCTTDIDSEINMVVQSEQFWRWRSNPNTYSGEEPHYYSWENNYSQQQAVSSEQWGFLR